MTIVWLVVGCSAYGIHFSAKFVAYNIFVTAAVKDVIVIVTILILIPIYQRVSLTLLNINYNSYSYLPKADFKINRFELYHVLKINCYELSFSY